MPCKAERDIALQYRVQFTSTTNECTEHAVDLVEEMMLFAQVAIVLVSATGLEHRDAFVS